MKIQTIHHNGLAFFQDEEHEVRTRWGSPNSVSIVYRGLIDDMPDSIAQKVVEIHPDFEKYMNDAMAVLYKLYTSKKGTESPQLAIKSRRDKKQRDLDYKFVVIWNIFG